MGRNPGDFAGNRTRALDHNAAQQHVTVRPTDPGNGFKNAPEPKLVLLYYFYVIMETLANRQH